MTSGNPSSPYSTRAVWLHWLTAALILLQWYMGRNLDWFPPPTVRMYARSTHMLIGLAVLAIVAERIWRRFRKPVAHPPGGPRWANDAATAVHWALYALVVAVILAGLVTVWMRGDPIFGLFRVPAFDPSHKEYRRIAGDFHGLLANILLGAAAFHALAALVHEWAWKDGVLARMIPVLRRS
jgi:cytochrome b561